MVTETLEKTVSDDSSAAHDRHHPAAVEATEAAATAAAAAAQASPSSWSTTSKRQGRPDDRSEEEEDEDHPLPLVSKDSHGSSSAAALSPPPARHHHHHPKVLVSDPSENPDAAMAAAAAAADAAKRSPGDASPALKAHAINTHHHHHHQDSSWHRRAPWPLLSSPISTRNVKRPSHGGETMSTSTPGFQPSPAMGGWPQRSPIKPEHDQEVASFALFTQSFDTLSGDDSSGHPFLRGSPGKAAAAAAHQSSLPQKSVPTASSSSSSHPPRKIQVLVGGRGGPRTDLEMGDISPIKLMEDPQPQPRQQLPYQHPPSSHSSSRGHHHDQGERHRYHHHHHHHGVEGRAGRYQHYYSAEQEQPPPPPPPPVYYDYHYNGRHDEPPPAARETGRPALPSNSTYNANGYSTSGASNPFFVLRSVRHAFDQCTYKLPCLLSDPHHVGLPVVNLSPYASSIQRYQQDGEHAAASPGEMDLARRRVDSTVHAFGGYYTTVPPPPAAEAARSSSHPSAIFRDRKSEQKEYYDSRFHRRYVVAGNHISWEVESNPPVLLMPSSEHGASRLRDSSLYPGDNPNHHHAGNGGGDEDPDDMLENHDGSVVPMDASQQKMKYRCKLCGQLKQNHNCPYQQSLQRSIAVMVYPAVNAFTACEPGVLTKPLSEMNNFVSYDEASFDPPPPHYNKGTSPDCHGRITHVTPETTTKTTHLLHSPESSLSTRSGQVVHHHHHHPPHYHQDHPSNINYDDPSPHRAGQKRNHSHVDTSASMAVTTTPPSTDRMAAANSTSRSSPSYFVPSTLGLRPEHYRAVTPRKMDDGSSPSSLVGVDGTSSEEYQYPHVPLTFQERKRLSDTLFFLSKEIPTMTDLVAPLLRMARERNEWDLAVAQILAQLVVALYCAEGDHCLVGLQRYLLGIGISC